MLDKLFRAAERFEASLKSSEYKRTAPRGLSEIDFDGFDVAVAARRRPKNTDEIIAILKRKNAVRMRRLHKDFRWLQREFIKMGLNPEDARELL